MEVAPATLGPFAREVAGRDRDLIRGRAHRGLERDPVAVRRNIVVPELGGVVEVSHPLLLREPVLAADVVVEELDFPAIAEYREIKAVEEGTIIDDMEIGIVVLEAGVL